MSSMTAAEEAQTLLSSVEIDEERFVGLLTKLIDNVATLQNNPSQVCVCLQQSLDTLDNISRRDTRAAT